MENNLVRDVPGARKAKIRLGRGSSSRRGDTCGRGQKGQTKRSGGTIRLGFAGGQTPLFRSLPKIGFKNSNALDLNTLNLDKLQLWIDQGRIDPNKIISMKEIHDSNICGKVKDGVKLLGNGARHFKTKIQIDVSRASKSAIERIEELGGKIVCSHYNYLALRLLLKPHKFMPPYPKRASPPHKLIDYYTNYENRGYLSEQIQSFYSSFWTQIEENREIYRDKYFKDHPEDIPVKYVPNPHDLPEEIVLSEGENNVNEIDSEKIEANNMNEDNNIIEANENNNINDDININDYNKLNENETVSVSNMNTIDNK